MKKREKESLRHRQGFPSSASSLEARQPGLLPAQEAQPGAGSRQGARRQRRAEKGEGRAEHRPGASGPSVGLLTSAKLCGADVPERASDISYYGIFYPNSPLCCQCPSILKMREGKRMNQWNRRVLPFQQYSSLSPSRIPLPHCQC